MRESPAAVARDLCPGDVGYLPPREVHDMRSIHLRRTSALAALLLGVALVLGGCSQIPSVVGEALGELVGRDYPAEVLDALAIADDAVTDVNEGVPSFSEDDLAYARGHLGYESYSMLDLLGRCGVAMACVGPETMPGPDEERESIGGHPSIGVAQREL